MLLKLNYNYYPFGSPMPGRQFNANSYKYGFNGKEKVDEINGSENDYDFGARIYDPRLGRFLKMDPAKSGFPFETPYSFAGNTPIQAIDQEGERIYYVNRDGTVLDLSISENIDKIDNANFKTAYKTLLDTYSGAELLSIMNTKYDNHDVFVGNATRHRYHNDAGALTGKYGDKDFQITLPLLTFRIGLNTSWDDNRKKYFSVERDKYELSEALYHEIWAHIFYKIEHPNSAGDEHHQKYGSYSMGLDPNRSLTDHNLTNSPQTVGAKDATPYKQIVSELIQLKNLGGASFEIKAPSSGKSPTDNTKKNTSKPKPKSVPMF